MSKGRLFVAVALAAVLGLARGGGGAGAAWGMLTAHVTLAAVAVGRVLGLDFDRIAASLAAFRGVHRRFERVQQSLRRRWQAHGGQFRKQGDPMARFDDTHQALETTAHKMQSCRLVSSCRRIRGAQLGHLFTQTVTTIQ